MDSARQIERVLFSCPEVDCMDDKTYPRVTEEDFMAMEQRFSENTASIHIYPYIRRNNAGKMFLDVYIWDVLLYPDTVRRFIIRKGCRLPAQDEDLFLNYLRSDFVSCDSDREEQLIEKITVSFLGRPFISLAADTIGRSLEQIYFVSHHSGPREILYKAGLECIAHDLDKIPSYNMIGTNPESIIGHDMPLKLIRILNQPELMYCLRSERRMKESRETYEIYHEYIGNELPSIGQWRYLEALAFGSFGDYGFIRALYNQLKYVWDMDLFDVYARFLGLRDEVSCLGRMKIPAPEEVREEVDKLETVKHYLTGKPFINDLIRDRKTENAFEYQGDQYSVIMPGSSLDFCKEAFSQKNCLMDYIDEHAVGETTILFIRKNEKPAKSFVTMEVLDGNIEQVYAGGNTLPRKEVFMFICEYAKRKGFSVDLKKLITENYLYEGYHNYYEELEKFAEEAGI